LNNGITQLEGWQLKALILSIVIAVGIYLAVSLWGGLHDVLGAFFHIGLLGTLIVLLLSLVNYGLRFIRWHVYLRVLGYQIDWLSSLRIYLSGFALTTTPGKAGEAFRGVFLKQYHVPFPTTFAALISERLSDLVAIILLTLLGLSEYPQARNIVLVGVLAVVLILVSISSRKALSSIQGFISVKTGKIFKLLDQVVRLLIEARRCHTLKLLVFSTIISIVSWGAEAIAFYLVLEWLGTDVSLSFAVFIYSISMLAGAISFLPGGLGSSEAVMISLLLLKGVLMPTAIAATVFIRLATLWFAVAIGLFAMYKSRHGELITS